MKSKKYIAPILTVIAGVLAQANAMGLMGEPQTNFLTLYWPILFAFIALDLFLLHHRMVSALVLLFTAGALLGSESIPKGGEMLWNLFRVYWPVLVILYGTDALLHGKNPFLSLVIAVLIIGFAAFWPYLGIPLKGAFSTSPFASTQSTAKSVPTEEPVFFQKSSNTVSEHRIDYDRPISGPAKVSITAPSGKIQLRGANLGGRFINGRITLMPGEMFEDSMTVIDGANIYTITASGATSGGSTDSDWNLVLDPAVQTALEIELEKGYLKTDLRGVNLLTATLENDAGPIDIMAPDRSMSPVKVIAGKGDIRVYVPAGSGVKLVFSGTTNIVFPDDYARTGNMVQPSDYKIVPVDFEVSSRGGQIQIIKVDALGASE